MPPAILDRFVVLFSAGLRPFLAALAARPGARWAAVLAGGVVLAAASAAEYARAVRAADAATAARVELVHGRLPYAPNGRVRAATDRGTEIVLLEPHARHGGAELAGLECELLRSAGVEDRLIRRGPADDASNCHGWVFTGGLSPVAAEDVGRILNENGYRAVADPLPGDLILYGSPTAPTHTGIVRYVADDQPVLVEGKWGIYGVFLHPADDSPYGTDYTFHRSPRPGHLLAGIPDPGGPIG